jgi:hypothetical protein
VLPTRDHFWRSAARCAHARTTDAVGAFGLAIGVSDRIWSSPARERDGIGVSERRPFGGWRCIFWGVIQDSGDHGNLKRTANLKIRHRRS